MFNFDYFYKYFYIACIGQKSGTRSSVLHDKRSYRANRSVYQFLSKFNDFHCTVFGNRSTVPKVSGALHEIW